MSAEVRYEVTIKADEITARLLAPGREQQFTEQLARDEQRRLQLDTISMLRSWLARWPALTRLTGYKHLIVRNTATILGRHLYAAVFAGAIRRGLDDALAAARAVPTKLQLVLVFHESAQELAQQPWELLNIDGDFLASEHRLVLSRRLPSDRREFGPPKPPLVVQFLVTLPDTDNYRVQRDELIDVLSHSMEEYTTSISHRVMTDWNEAEATRQLGKAPYPQIVHIVGVCRPIREEPDQMQIFVDEGEGDGPDWISAQTLINIFRDNEMLPEQDQVRLVVLHLCEPTPLDFEVTFERLAPALIRRGIPAVLAMQYPLTGKEAGRFVKRLYESLPAAESVEEAVQLARAYLYTHTGPDRFGSPVLYMQTMNSQLLKLSTGASAAVGTGAGSAGSSTAPPPPVSVLDWLLEHLVHLDRPEDLLREAAGVLRDLEWPSQLSEAGLLVARQVREYAYWPDLAEVFRELKKAVNEELGDSDD